MYVMLIKLLIENSAVYALSAQSVSIPIYILVNSYFCQNITFASGDESSM